MNENNVGNNDTNYMASDEKPYAQSRKKYMIMFKENRSTELYVGRTYNRFEPYGQLEVDDDFINHPDFKQQEKYFAVKEL